jgi:Acyl-ACP thioesterase
LAGPPTDGPRSPWPLRASDVDLHGHVNNTVYWQAIEHVLFAAGPELERPLCARLEFREPLELAVTGDEHRLDVGFVANGRTKAVAAIEDKVGPPLLQPM